MKKVSVNKLNPKCADIKEIIFVVSTFLLGEYVFESDRFKKIIVSEMFNMLK